MITLRVEGDLKVGILTAKAGADGALLTAKINILMLKDKNRAEELLKQIGIIQGKLDKVLLDKAYIVGKMEELMKTPIMQEYVYLQTKLKESEAHADGLPEEDKKE